MIRIKMQWEGKTRGIWLPPSNIYNVVGKGMETTMCHYDDAPRPTASGMSELENWMNLNAGFVFSTKTCYVNIASILRYKGILYNIWCYRF